MQIESAKLMLRMRLSWEVWMGADCRQGTDQLIALALNCSSLGLRSIIMPTCQDAVLLSRLLPADLQRGVQDVIEAQVSHRPRHCSQKGPPPTSAR